MININVQNNIIALKDIEQSQLSKILGWYNLSDDYKFATGVDVPVCFDNIMDKYQNISDDDFCSAIIKIDDTNEGRLVGIVNGKLFGKILWIKMLAIDHEHQGKGLGSLSLNLLLQYMKTHWEIQNVYLAVVENNVQGKNFWLKNGFCEFKKADSQILLGGSKYNIIIMHKRLVDGINY